MSVPATPRFDGDNTSNYMYNPPYDTAPPRDGIKDATKDSTTYAVVYDCSKNRGIRHCTGIAQANQLFVPSKLCKQAFTLGDTYLTVASTQDQNF